jgi:hypothetical protein
VLLAVVLFVLSAAITLLILAGGSRARTSADAGGAKPDAGPRSGVEAVVSGAAGRSSLSVGDFLLEDEQGGEEPPYLLRPRTPRWSDEQVQRYWVPLKDVILDIVSRQSDRRIDQILEDVE